MIRPKGYLANIYGVYNVLKLINIDVYNLIAVKELFMHARNVLSVNLSL